MNLENPVSWSKLGRVEVIKKWSEEVNLAVERKLSLDDWGLVGHAITIIHDDVEDCRKILQRVAHDLNFKFTALDNSSVFKNFSDENVLNEADSPCLVYLEPGLWMKPMEDESNDDLIASTQSNICSLIKSFRPSKPVIYVTSTSELHKLSPKFREVGLFDRRFEIIKPTLEEIAENFLETLGYEICADSLRTELGKVGKLLDSDFDDKRRKELVALTLKRIAKQETRKIEFADLLNISLQGSGEFDAYPVKSEESLRKIAIHEAGHAAVAIIDSNGENMPEFASIIESQTYNGIVAESIAYHYSKNNRKSYADVRHQIRISLAGRVAEHLVLGSENVRVSSAKSDLEKATNLCFDMFAEKGISDDMETFEGACSNLNVNLDPERNSPNNLFRLETMTQNYLNKQYKIVYEMLVKNRKVLDSIIEQLMKKSILNQQELINIHQKNISVA